MKPKNIIFTIDSDEEIEDDESSDEEEVMEKRKRNKNAFFNMNKKVSLGESDENENEIVKESVGIFQNKSSSFIELFPEEDEDEEDLPDRLKPIKKVYHQRKNQIQKPPSKEDNDFDEKFFNVELSKEAISNKDEYTSFDSFKLSQPLRQSLRENEWFVPTEVQKQTIPVLLKGHDICASSKTGTGKTLAFLVPSVERLLLYRKTVGGDGHREIERNVRILVILPTRELAKQCFDTCRLLCKYTDIHVGFIIGGFENVRKQRKMIFQDRPEILVCTPGRLIYHLLNHERNDENFLRFLDVLILDEADRLLEFGFIDGIKEILKFCPTTRQNILFSATMTDNVKDLMKLSFTKAPARICVDDKKDVPFELEEEFIKIKSFSSSSSTTTTTSSSSSDSSFDPSSTGFFMNKKKKEKDLTKSEKSTETKERNYRESVLLSLVFHTLPKLGRKRIIIFVNRKIDARRLKVIFHFCQRSCSELHGDLNLTQRLAELEKFKREQTNILITTDVGSRGLDILDVDTVINFYMPHNLNVYIHRVGRTARMGRSGLAISLIDETSRKMLREVIKRARKRGLQDFIKQRIVDVDVVKHYQKELKRKQKEVFNFVAKGIMEKETARAEKALKKTEKALKWSDETILENSEVPDNNEHQWFQSKKEKELTKKREKEIIQVNHSGRKRLREILDTDGEFWKLKNTRKKKRRRLNNGEKDEEEEKNERNLLKVSKVRERKKNKQRIQNLGGKSIDAIQEERNKRNKNRRMRKRKRNKKNNNNNNKQQQEDS